MGPQVGERLGAADVEPVEHLVGQLGRALVHGLLVGSGPDGEDHGAGDDEAAREEQGDAQADGHGRSSR
jgi:hypothetical protein